MKRLTCECGSQSFKANPDSPMLQCCNCNQRKKWSVDNKWQVFVISKVNFCAELASEVVPTAKKTFEFLESFMPKLRHPKREKSLFSLLPKASVKNIPGVITADKDVKLIHLRKKWKHELSLLKMSGFYLFGKHCHKGKLRCKHAAKAFHSDCKKLGIKTRLKFVKDQAVVEAV